MGNDSDPLDANFDGQRKKKLIAGVRYSLYISTPGKQAYQCKGCEKQDKRNCHNVKKYKHSILTGVEEWKLVTPSLRHVLKVGQTKFFECPISAITGKTWKIVGLVNETTNSEGDILHLPFQGCYEDQPQWYKDAVVIVKSERARHRAEQMEKPRGK